jgi:CRISPR system Cascade subunit CasE
MYLSRLELNPRSPDVRHDLTSPYELHRTLSRVFPTPDGQDYRATHGVLFRLEPQAYTQTRPVVLVQSVTAPDWAQLPASYGFATSKPLAPAFSAGQMLGFRLVANPTKKEKREGQRQGRRVPLFDANAPTDASDPDQTTPAQQWLHRKGEQHGFEVVYVVTEEFRLADVQAGVKPSASAAKQGLRLYGVRFDGLLRVTDPALLLDAVRQGIGPAKAFGFGLLSLAPAGIKD